MPIHDNFRPSERSGLNDHPDFQTLRDYLDSERFEAVSDVSRCIHRYTDIIGRYSTTDRSPTSPSNLANYRNYVQHRVMSLPVGDDDQDQIYEMLRVSLIIYSILVVMPLPLVVCPFDELAENLKRSTLKLSRGLGIPTDLRNLLVWTATLGALAAYDSDSRSWYILILERLCRRASIFSAADYVSALHSFLWLPCVSDADATNLWLELESSDPFQVHL